MYLKLHLLTNSSCSMLIYRLFGDILLVNFPRKDAKTYILATISHKKSANLSLAEKKSDCMWISQPKDLPKQSSVPHIGVWGGKISSDNNRNFSQKKDAKCTFIQKEKINEFGGMLRKYSAKNK